jgi:hypothetical protein
MKIPHAEARALLRTARHGALGTHSLSHPGFPFVSILPYVADLEGRPVFLVSGLAEHTRNLRVDPRASLMVAEAGEDVLTTPRLTLLGEVWEVTLDACAQARYLRYRPEAADYLALGDFRFFRLEPRQLRLVSGFARMGWLIPEVPAWVPEGAEEGAAVARLQQLAPPGVGVLGLDGDGLDLRVAGQVRRWNLPASDLAALLEQAEILLGQLAAPDCLPPLG